MRLTLLLVLAVAGCAAHPPDPAQPHATTATDELLARAVADAADANPNEVATDLVALVPGNERIVWRVDDAGDLWVLLATWTDWSGYEGLVGQRIPLERTLWATAAPEAQTFCRSTGLHGAELGLRLEQYLGLHPASGKTHFVTMWARARELVRPCPDAEVDDTRCEARGTADDVQIGTHAHRAWFDALREISYGPGGYPWTRLGYTYDWAPGAGERGASEFLAPAGALIEVMSFTSTDEYCH